MLDSLTYQHYTSTCYYANYDNLSCSPGCSAESTPPNEKSRDYRLSKVSRWHEEGVANLLTDAKGVELFKEFMHRDASQQLLDFWFACKGFKNEMTARGDCEHARKLARAISRTFLSAASTQALVWLRGDERAQVARRVLADPPSIDANMFDSLQTQAFCLLQERLTHFLRSDIVREWCSFGGAPPAPVEEDPTLLFEEDASRTIVDDATSILSLDSIADSLQSVSVDEAPQARRSASATSLTARSTRKSIPLTSSGIASTVRERRLRDLGATTKQKSSKTYCLPASQFVLPPNPYHTNYVPPPTVQHSDVHSKSSGSTGFYSMGSSCSEGARERLLKSAISRTQEQMMVASAPAPPVVLSLNRAGRELATQPPLQSGRKSASTHFVASASTSSAPCRPMGSHTDFMIKNAAQNRDVALMPPAQQFLPEIVKDRAQFDRNTETGVQMAELAQKHPAQFAVIICERLRHIPADYKQRCRQAMEMSRRRALLTMAESGSHAATAQAILKFGATAERFVVGDDDDDADGLSILDKHIESEQFNRRLLKDSTSVTKCENGSSALSSPANETSRRRAAPVVVGASLREMKK